MKFITILAYFIFVIVFLSSIGVSLPYIFDKANCDPNIYKNLYQNVITYFIAILITCSLDYVMKIVDKELRFKKFAILITCMVNVGIILWAGYTLYVNSKVGFKELPCVCIVGVLVAFIAWWVVNYNNSSFNITASLGGDVEKTLSSGK